MCISTTEYARMIESVVKRKHQSSLTRIDRWKIEAEETLLENVHHHKMPEYIELLNIYHRIDDIVDIKILSHENWIDDLNLAILTGNTGNFSHKFSEIHKKMSVTFLVTLSMNSSDRTIHYIHCIHKKRNKMTNSFQ